MNYPTRQLELILKDIAKKHEYKLTTIASGWINILERKGKMMPIYGYNFPNNNASITKIFDDKSGFSEILIKNKIKCFSHTYFMKGYYELSSVKTLFSSLNEDVVIKPNVGSGGNNVYHCTSFSDLEEKINLITSSHLGFCISPFYSYTTEYRAIILNKKIKIVYQKIKKDEEWRFNLGLGASFSDDVSTSIINKIQKVISSVIKILPISFCSIDFAFINNEPYIVEGNSGVMMEKYSKADKLHYKKAFKVYEKAIKSFFASLKK